MMGIHPIIVLLVTATQTSGDYKMINDKEHDRNSFDCRTTDSPRYIFKSMSLKLLTAFLLLVVTSSLQAQDNALNFSGDFRLRFERTSNQEPNAQSLFKNPRNREVVRLRLGITKKINDFIKFGSRLATGSADDPNTADITLGDFVNDLSFTLDRVYMEFLYKSLFLTGGKFGNPFIATDLVWDGDVNPQGVAGSLTLPSSEQLIPRITGMYYVVDEQSSNPDSYMWGGQMRFTINPNADWSLTFAGAYYDYNIEHLGNADGGDTRSNYLTLDADSNLVYVSDFNLIDAIATIEYRGLNERFPIRIVGDFVKNDGAKVDEDQGFAVDVFVGKASKKNDLRFQYGYSEMETDAVLAAFSHDNTTIATNYQQHTLAADFVIFDNTTLNLTWYLYRTNKLPAPGVENDYFSRLRLNAVVGL